jgi:hypothetical protein
VCFVLTLNKDLIYECQVLPNLQQKFQEALLPFPLPHQPLPIPLPNPLLAPLPLRPAVFPLPLQPLPYPAVLPLPDQPSPHPPPANGRPPPPPCWRFAFKPFDRTWPVQWMCLALIVGLYIG